MRKRKNVMSSGEETRKAKQLDIDGSWIPQHKHQNKCNKKAEFNPFFLFFT